ncbi:MAG: 1-deoxy-D-xylulose-5-phosphate reductoisomerase [Mariprofundaceae bacterium]|nr:1-deoxy-D-xylulose-5-phosphate reductoisomerase [Mariprofundaceae bacterium]
MKHVCVLGATGSIGLSTADVIMQHPHDFAVDTLVAHRNVAEMSRLMAQLHPRCVVLTDEQAADDLRQRHPVTDIIIASGMDAATEAAADPRSDTVVAAMVGAAGVPATLAAVQAGKTVCLANKECLVTAGRLFMRTAEACGATIVPVDSEHAAVHQALQGHDRDSVRRIILTASGGPFRQRSPESLLNVTPEEAIAHPNWDMGAKISVDSATMMNKALELIEARWLFDAAPETLEAIIHPQSIVHAMVEYNDGSVLAQMAMPDMRSPIAYALQSTPRLSSGIPWLELAQQQPLEFFAIDTARFPAMALVQQVMRGDDGLAVIMNAANEVANEAFRQRRIGFMAIVALVEQTLAAMTCTPVTTLKDIWQLDQHSRLTTEELISR